MYNVTDDFIEQIGIAGKEIDTRIINGNSEIIPHTFKHSFSGNIFTSIMQKIEFEVKNGNILEESTVLQPKYGLKINNGYEYLDYSDYNVYSSEINYDTGIVKTVAYDNMIKFMTNYSLDNLDITFPTTILGLINAICNYIGVELYSTDFFNTDLTISSDLFTNLNCTYRDVIDYICQATLTTAIIKDNELYFKETINTNKTITPEILKKFKLKQKFGGCNSLVLGRGDLNDNVYVKDDTLIEQDGLQEIRFDDNEILDKQRELVIDSMFLQIRGLTYYSFETKDLGIGIFEPADFCKMEDLDGNKYNVLILNQSITVTSGCEGAMSADIPNSSTTKYQYATDSQKRQTKTEITVDKQNQVIESVVSQTTDPDNPDSMVNRLTRAQQDLSGFQREISELDLENNIKTLNELKETVDGWEQRIDQKGGNNIFYYAKEFWTGETDSTTAHFEEESDITKQYSVSGMGYLIKQGLSKQKVQVNNDTYTISFLYKKTNNLATGYVLINGDQYDLTETDWTEFNVTIDIDTSTIDFEIYSDTDNAFYIFDLMGNVGNEKEIWTQNPNETRTDTVTIGKGIQVNSSTTNTYTRIDADGNRTFNASTNEPVMEATDKGVNAKQVTTDIAIIAGILIQEIDGQTWISSLL